ncbi:hypothetical protein QBC37DRAFT_280288, partial [Rhypophila decipiens]
FTLDKANLLAGYIPANVVSEVMAYKFSRLEVCHQLIDSKAHFDGRQEPEGPEWFITSNLFAISSVTNEVGVIPGNICASLGGIPEVKGKCIGIYEPIQGSVPDISGRGIVNPVGTIL